MTNLLILSYSLVTNGIGLTVYDEERNKTNESKIVVYAREIQTVERQAVIGFQVGTNQVPLFTNRVFVMQLP